MSDASTKASSKLPGGGRLVGLCSGYWAERCVEELKKHFVRSFGWLVCLFVWLFSSWLVGQLLVS